MDKISWKEWCPGINNDHLTLGEVRATLPGNDPESISLIVRLFENPKSPIAFKGAISLERHDCVHILLGRGLMPQDEAFVIGYTMGTSQSLSAIETGLFKWITEHLYPAPYNLTAAHHSVYDLGLAVGRSSVYREIFHAPLEEMNDLTLGEIRKRFGVDTKKLYATYQCEKVLFPTSHESKRLLREFHIL